MKQYSISSEFIFKLYHDRVRDNMVRQSPLTNKHPFRLGCLAFYVINKSPLTGYVDNFALPRLHPTFQGALGLWIQNFERK